ncbi:hypothetical protein Tdes44962_MAKER04304 [Teratosphaeria destructans]|uniref:Uncharacterized protein n=1 Tax=Teratosphaeria destructans TaxID=418781 RepID=A0A9W7SMP2_9PEZI|nr:hypothetical protein Tdes44962_MAKER04304 [Teratosphaeria destructans]
MAGPRFEAAYRKLRRGLTAEIQRQIDAQTGIHPTSGAYSQYSAVPGHSQILTSPGKRKRQSSEVAGIQNEVQRLKALVAEVQTTPTTAEPVGTLATLSPPKPTYKDLSAAARVAFWTRRLNKDVIVWWYARFAGVVDVAATMRDPAMRLFLMDRMIRACDNVFNFVIGIELANEELRANADIQLRSSSGFDLETADFIQAFKDHSSDYKRRNPTAEIDKLEKIMVPAEIATRLDV